MTLVRREQPYQHDNVYIYLVRYTHNVVGCVRSCAIVFIVSRRKKIINKGWALITFLTFNNNNNKSVKLKFEQFVRSWLPMGYNLK